MRFLSIFLLSILFFSTSVSSTKIPTAQTGLKVSIVEKSAGSTTFSIDFSKPSWKTSESDDHHKYLEIDGLELDCSAGMPIIPITSQLIRLPLTGGGRIEILSTACDTFKNIDYALYRSNSLNSNLDQINYTELYPENLVTIGTPAILHDFRVASLQLSPVQVNNQTGEVFYYKNIEFTVHFDRNDDSNTLTSYPFSISETFLPFYRNFLDWEESELDNFEIYRGKVIVITPGLESIITALQPWIEWKKQKGWSLEFITDTDVNWNETSIRAELIERYEASNPKFDYVVIIGDDHNPVYSPPATGVVYGGGDQGYATLAGNDDLVDVAVGRISVESVLQLTAYVNKVLNYEKTPYMEDTSWYKRGLASAGSSASGISTVFLARYAVSEMERAGYDEPLFTAYNDGIPTPVNDRNIEILNTGTSFHLYRGFLSTGITASDIEALQNSFRTPVVIDITCGRGNWVNGYSINEAYMRAGTVQTPRGAIGAISTATANTHTKFNNSLSGGGIYATFNSDYPTLGSIIMGAKVNMWINLAEYYPDQVADFNNWTNLMGDPTVCVWTDIPRELTVVAPAEVELGQNSYSVSVSDDNGPLENAWVTIYKSDENEEVIAHNITNENGTVDLLIPFSFTGEAVLTATSHNAHPFIQEVSIINTQNRIGITEVSLLDDNSQGTSGNGNGIAEYGETVGLFFDLHNYGTNDYSDISLNLSSDDEWIATISGNVEITSLIAGGEISSGTPILVTIEENVPDHWLCPLQTNILSGENLFEDYYYLEVSAPQYIQLEAESNNTPAPGSTSDITLQITNLGSANGIAGNITLTSNDEWLIINNPTSTIPSITPGTTQLTATLNISASEEAFRGYRAPASINIEYDNGRNEDIPVYIYLGDAETSDPTGPDDYGYYAIDNTDINYDQSPFYNWIEINTDNLNANYQGTRLDLEDNGYNQDASICIDLPFAFTYYSQEYDQITVCTNGWLAMGDQSDIALQRNWTIPSPVGPSSMLAPFWDDRTLGNNGVYAHYAAEEGKFIVQWDSVFDSAGESPCTFEVILYEQNEGNPTSTGDSDFLFQYKEINISEGIQSDVAYFTTGIENSTQDSGLLYAYLNNYEPGAAAIEDERTILFTIRQEMTKGTICGTVTDGESGDSLAGVSVVTAYLGASTTTDENGYYEIPSISGTNSLSFSLPNFRREIVSDINVPVNETVTVNVSMSPPALSVNPSELDIVLIEGHTNTADITITNMSNETINYELFMSSFDPTGEITTIGENLESYALNETLVDDYIAGLVYDGLYYLVMTSWNDSGHSTIYRYSDSGEYIDLIDLENEYYDMQYNGSQLIFNAWSDIDWYDYDHENLSFSHSINTNLSSLDVTVDEDHNLLYVADFQEINIHNFQGTYLGTLCQTSIVPGIRIVPDDPDGKTIHFIDVVRENTIWTSEVKRIRPDGTGLETMFHFFGLDAYSCIGFDIYNLPDDLNSYIGVADISNDHAQLNIFNYLPNYDLVSLSTDSGTLSPGDEDIIILTFNEENLPPDDYIKWFICNYDYFPGISNVPVRVTINVDEIKTDPEPPLRWALDKIYPNPFNPTTCVSYSLKSATHVDMTLYNINGQVVKKLLSENKQAGEHRLQIDGNNLASGLYFLKMKAGPINMTRKLILLK